MSNSIKSLLFVGGMLMACTGSQAGKLDKLTKQLECRAEALLPFEDVFSPAQLAKMLSGDVDAVEVLKATEEAPEAVEEFVQVWKACDEKDES